MPNRKSFALLIDSDNISAKYIPGIMNELVNRHGQVTYRRVYGDWTSPQMAKWKDVLADYSLEPMQQFANIKGKNATDSFLIIDAMDILYQGNVQGFCIVSSDSDFTRLASRLRDAGMTVVGMGEQKTPRSFRNACTVFTTLEVLVEDDQSEGPSESEDSGEENPVTRKEITSAIVDIINENSDNGRTTDLSEIGSRLVDNYPDFDVRTYGYSQLSKFLESFQNITLSHKNNVVLVDLKDGHQGKEEVTRAIFEEIESHDNQGVPLSYLGNMISDKFPNFSVKDYGFSKLSKFLRDMKGISVESHKGEWRVYSNRAQKAAGKPKKR